MVSTWVLKSTAWYLEVIGGSWFSALHHYREWYVHRMVGQSIIEIDVLQSILLTVSC